MSFELVMDKNGGTKAEMKMESGLKKHGFVFPNNDAPEFRELFRKLKEGDKLIIDVKKKEDEE